MERNNQPNLAQDESCLDKRPSLPTREDPLRDSSATFFSPEFIKKIDACSLESLVNLKISRFLDQVGSYYPENLHSLIMKKVEKPLVHQILKRTGGNQVHTARILGINRNTLRKKIKMYELD